MSEAEAPGQNAGPADERCLLGSSPRPRQRRFRRLSGFGQALEFHGREGGTRRFLVVEGIGGAHRQLGILANVLLRENIEHRDLGAGVPLGPVALEFAIEALSLFLHHRSLLLTM